ncbi:cache domain-containing protein [Jannaschia seohaensis]|uniref:Two-component system NarL family sensor kinase n=1 Tax=Jannaschia seohaensis TaxID=475081 RepID=A0A2Y9C0P5_9RHOB|nr:cache domain-containing protein [Jannaschia seohaensis]PWJ18058.1 two-component system NarL family sensor kinase [Jannaschia seohaensis]SSA46582.1 two-component system, NarL family, sensor kinase [Jannaschia seohaensis]
MLSRLSYGQRLLLLAALPLIVAVGAIAVLVTLQSERMAQREIETLEAAMITAKQRELRNYLQLARTSFITIYGNAAPDDEAAKLRVTQILSAMIYGQDGFFFVFDYDGTNLVAPRQTWLIGRNWSGLEDAEGTPVTDRLIALARQGAGYHSYIWRKPSTGEESTVLTYVIGLQDWQWAIGTGVFLDDVLAQVETARADVRAEVRAQFLRIGAIALLALLAVFSSGFLITVRERRLADVKLKELTQRVLDTQEEERGRVARELHDGISQLLAGIRFRLELARRLTAKGDAKAEGAVDAAIEGLQSAIGEVRRISHDLRPGVLDDLGLSPALKTLCEAFEARTGISVEFRTVVFRNRLDIEAKTALYRIAQEALTNIERHAEATRVSVRVYGHRRGATLRVEDDGRGISRARHGLGLRNMAERIEQLDGTLTLTSGPEGRGTVVEATVPLTHLLAPAGQDAPRQAAE